MTRPWFVPVVYLISTATCVAVVACVDRDAVFAALPLFEDPPPASKGFLGYSSGNKLPICGNCHVGFGAQWQGTAHAHAWDALEDNPLADETCEECHTVGANGNWVTDENVAWAATHDTRYQDVQCESCHGPGLEHVIDPDAFQPLPSIDVGLDLTSGCGECHSGAHQPFVEEWSQSRHGNMNPFPQTKAACVQCHEARGILEAWGVTAEYLEKDGNTPIPITCAVCHDPHDATNSRQLRFPIEEPNEATNLCMRCHNRGGAPDPTLGGRPHSPQGPLLLGTAGWRPPNFTFADDTIVATHGTSANPRMCATCHLNRIEVINPETGGSVFNATGHLFQATPCLDADGKPTTAVSCNITERSFDGCVQSGCHGTVESVRSALTVSRGRASTLVTTLEGLLGQIPVSEFDNGDGRLTTAEGAQFNAELASLRGSPVHNPFLIEALLQASITQVMSDYGVSEAQRQ